MHELGQAEKSTCLFRVWLGFSICLELSTLPGLKPFQWLLEEPLLGEWNVWWTTRDHIKASP